MQQWGVSYWETYAPVVNWISVQFLLIISKLAGLESRAIDFVLAFPQADLDVPVYMELPIVMEVPGSEGRNKFYVLIIIKSIYGLKQASANWNDMLKRGLEILGFSESVADPCVFNTHNEDVFKAVAGDTSTLSSDGIDPRGGWSICNDDADNSQIDRDAVSSTNTLKSASASDIAGVTMIKSNTLNLDNYWINIFQHKSSDILLLVYVDDRIILSLDQKLIDMFINTLKYGPKRFVFTDKGLLHQYLGV